MLRYRAESGSGRGKDLHVFGMYDEKEKEGRVCMYGMVSHGIGQMGVALENAGT
jgi:hypothetical protein